MVVRTAKVTFIIEIFQQVLILKKFAPVYMVFTCGGFLFPHDDMCMEKMITYINKTKSLRLETSQVIDRIGPC